MRVFILAAVAVAFGLAQTTPVRAASAFVVSPGGDFDHLHFLATTGEANDVSINFAPDFSGVDVTDSGATITPGAGCTTLTPRKVRCMVGADPFINASLGDGNDILSISRRFESSGGRLQGGDGDDRIRGDNTPGTHERLLGGLGDDTLLGRGGSDLLDGGPGADDLSGGTSCQDETAGLCFIDSDTVSYAGRVQNIRADADGNASDDGQRREGDTIFADVERIVGGKGNDHLGGITTNFFPFDGHFRFVGMELIGAEGDDHLRGGRAPDGLFGGPGDDVIHGAGQGDGLHGGRGDDRLVGGPGHDGFSGGKGRDRLLARDGLSDRVNGGPGKDAAQVDPPLDHVARVENLF
jgi:Ca2+-binding RTX toxin-like protein